MKVTTTFWNDKVFEYEKLFYINGKNHEIVFQADLNDKWATFLFFKSLANFVRSKSVLNTINTNSWDRQEYYQFAVLHEGKVCPIKWFDLVVNEQLKVSHDIAFETTLIKRNNVVIPLGLFPQWTRKKTLAKYREFKLKARAYNFMANILKNS